MGKLWIIERVGRYPDCVDDRRVGDDASFYPVPCWLTILISPATPAPYRYTGLGLVPLINASAFSVAVRDLITLNII
jgi:hypothetical protein